MLVPILSITNVRRLLLSAFALSLLVLVLPASGKADGALVSSEPVICIQEAGSPCVDKQFCEMFPLECEAGEEPVCMIEPWECDEEGPICLPEVNTPCPGSDDESPECPGVPLCEQVTPVSMVTGEMNAAGGVAKAKARKHRSRGRSAGSGSIGRGRCRAERRRHVAH